jgi:glyoxylase I family protein
MAITIEAVDIGVFVRDIDACLKFYCEDLGLTKVGEVEFPGGRTQHRIQLGPSLLKLMHFATDAPPAGPRGRLAQTGIRYITLAVPDVSALVKELKAKGHTFVVPVTKSPTGRWIAMIEDPEGNTLELMSG